MIFEIHMDMKWTPGAVAAAVVQPFPEHAARLFTCTISKLQEKKTRETVRSSVVAMDGERGGGMNRGSSGIFKEMQLYNVVIVDT